MPPADRLRAAIAASGLSARQFAVRVMGRDERTVRRWLAGETMPDTALAWLARLAKVTDSGRATRILLRD